VEQELTCLLNGREVSFDLLSETVRRAVEHDGLIRAGGFLIKCYRGSDQPDPDRQSRDAFHLGILPVIDGGLRNRHYDIAISGDPTYTLTGFLNTDHTLGLVFMPPSKGSPSAEFLDRIRRQYIECVRSLVDTGVPADWEFDWITRQAAKEAGLFHDEITTAGALIAGE
jgi:hypothetical protein